MNAYYNEFDPAAAEWLRWLIAQGHIAPGVVDSRSITEVQPDDLIGFTQCHFFAGIGGWSYAARLAGWPDDRPLWTGSCPCQPFSVAGKGGGVDDARHLWPDFFRLIGARRPPVVMGEQVAGSAGYGWLDGVRADLAGEGYASRGVDIPACAVDAPHIRSRLWWCAVADAESIERGAGLRQDRAIGNGAEPANRDGGNGLLADAESQRGGRDEPQRRPEERAADGRVDAGSDLANRHVFGAQIQTSGRQPAIEGRVCADDSRRNVGDADSGGARSQPGNAGEMRGFPQAQCQSELGPAIPRGTDGRNGTFWTDADWLTCHDGKARRTQPGTPLLVDGLPGRVAAWRGFGNAIVPQVAAEVIAAFMETTP